MNRAGGLSFLGKTHDQFIEHAIRSTQKTPRARVPADKPSDEGEVYMDALAIRSSILFYLRVSLTERPQSKPLTDQVINYVMEREPTLPKRQVKRLVMEEISKLVVEKEVTHNGRYLGLVRSPNEVPLGRM